MTTKQRKRQRLPQVGAGLVSDDTPATFLWERNLPASNGRGFRRYQIVRFVRRDRIWEQREDLGPADAFKCHEFGVQGGAVREDGRIESWHTVGELREIAAARRANPYVPAHLLAPPADWAQQIERHFYGLADAAKGRKRFAT